MGGSESGETSPGDLDDLETATASATSKVLGESSSSLDTAVPPQDGSSWAFVSIDPNAFEEETLEACEGTADAAVHHSDLAACAEQAVAALHSLNVTHSAE